MCECDPAHHSNQERQTIYDKLKYKQQSLQLTSIWRAPSFSMRGSGMHLRIASKRGPRSSDKLSADIPAFPLRPIAKTVWKSHYHFKKNINIRTRI